MIECAGATQWALSGGGPIFGHIPDPVTSMDCKRSVLTGSLFKLIDRPNLKRQPTNSEEGMFHYCTNVDHLICLNVTKCQATLSCSQTCL